MFKAQSIKSVGPLINESLDDPILVESDSDVIFCLDPELRLTYCNAGWDRFAKENGAPELCRPAPLGRSVLDYMREPDREYYARAFRGVLAEAQPWEHLYECSSSDLYRQFRVRVLPLMRQAGLLVIHSLQVGHAYQYVRFAEERYRNGQGLILMCAGCRRTRRHAPGEEVWEWVPHFVERMPTCISHGICSPCREHYYRGEY